MFALTELAEITELKYFISGKAGKKEHRLSLCTLCSARDRVLCVCRRQTNLILLRDSLYDIGSIFNKVLIKP
jgi:hypothetical protein